MMICQTQNDSRCSVLPMARWGASPPDPPFKWCYRFFGNLRRFFGNSLSEIMTGTVEKNERASRQTSRRQNYQLERTVVDVW